MERGGELEAESAGESGRMATRHEHKAGGLRALGRHRGGKDGADESAAVEW